MSFNSDNDYLSDHDEPLTTTTLNSNHATMIEIIGMKEAFQQTIRRDRGKRTRSTTHRRNTAPQTPIIKRRGKMVRMRREDYSSSSSSRSNCSSSSSKSSNGSFSSSSSNNNSGISSIISLENNNDRPKKNDHNPYKSNGYRNNNKNKNRNNGNNQVQNIININKKEDNNHSQFRKVNQDYNHSRKELTTTKNINNISESNDIETQIRQARSMILQGTTTTNIEQKDNVASVISTINSTEDNNNNIIMNMANNDSTNNNDNNISSEKVMMKIINLDNTQEISDKSQTDQDKSINQNIQHDDDNNNSIDAASAKNTLHSTTNNEQNVHDAETKALPDTANITIAKVVNNITSKVHHNAIGGGTEETIVTTEINQTNNSIVQSAISAKKEEMDIIDDASASTLHDSDANITIISNEENIISSEEETQCIKNDNVTETIVDAEAQQARSAAAAAAIQSIIDEHMEKKDNDDGGGDDDVHSTLLDDNNDNEQKVDDTQTSTLDDTTNNNENNGDEDDIVSIDDDKPSSSIEEIKSTNDIVIETSVAESQQATGIDQGTNIDQEENQNNIDNASDSPNTLESKIHNIIVASDDKNSSCEQLQGTKNGVEETQQAKSIIEGTIDEQNQKKDNVLIISKNDDDANNLSTISTDNRDGRDHHVDQHHINPIKIDIMENTCDDEKDNDDDDDGDDDDVDGDDSTDSGDFSFKSNDEGSIEIMNSLSKSFKSDKISSSPTFHKKMQAILTIVFVYILIAVPFTIYTITKLQQLVRMEKAFQSIATSVVNDTIAQNLHSKLQAIQQLSTLITSHAQITNTTFPFVSPLWDFHLHAQSAMFLSNALSIGLLVKVTNEEREIWEQEYITQNAKWLQDAQEYQARVKPEQTPIKSELSPPPSSSSSTTTKETQKRSWRSWGIGGTDRTSGEQGSRTGGAVGKYNYGQQKQQRGDPSQIHAWNHSKTNNDNFHPTRLGLHQVIQPYDLESYMPNWLIMPPNADLINFDFLSHDIARHGIAEVFDTNEPVLSGIEQASNSTFLQRYYAHLMQTQDQDYQGQFETSQSSSPIYEPISHLFVPVFDSFDLNNKSVEGIMYASLEWKYFFQHVIPTGSKPILCVIENACGGTFSYAINGNTTTFLGYSDQHDIYYDYLEQSINISAISTTHIQCTKCPYTIRVYPTAEFHHFYVTNTPLYDTLATLFVFTLLCLVGALYDSVTQQRIKRISKNAEKEQAIVASLFPAQFRKGLLRDNSDIKEGFNNSETNDQANQSANVRTNDNITGDVKQSSDDHTAIEAEKLDNSESNNNDIAIGGLGPFQGCPKTHLQTLLRNPVFEDEDEEDVILFAKPLADLFLHCTVLFANISGFSAWSSEREPEQVFTLLETIFQAMDRIAKKRKVFKVETISDSYVAVTGLPDPQPDHALRMAKFARDCTVRVKKLLSMLEMTLGPDTGDLKVRIGMNSGQVTAGVLRGEKSRFQIFGDTVNTASRMESTGKPAKIQMSKSTAILLIEEHDKANWVKSRDDCINVKGKGVVQSYWLEHNAADDTTTQSDLGGESSCNVDETEAEEDEIATGFADKKYLWEDKGRSGTLHPVSRLAKNKRLVEWLVDLFSTNLKLIIAQRRNHNQPTKSMLKGKNPNDLIDRGETLLDEMVEAFTLPKYDAPRRSAHIIPESIELGSTVTSQLRDYITQISERYRNNPFHNFEHASHVTMSVMKLLHRIVEPDDVDYQLSSANLIDSDKHNYTYGITSDALAQFAVAFSALIHDVDHTGVPNFQLAKENPELGEKYKQRAIAEQNSVDIAWDLLMQPEYKELQECIFTTEKELKRFRALVVNLVVATDIFDKKLKMLRNDRWDKAFYYYDDYKDPYETESTATPTSSSKDDDGDDGVETNLKATIVLEYIVQASDVSHTMQHWNVYKKWNERLFQEMYDAYENKRAGKDPSRGWYKGELWFFDNYIIPLAQKLEECRVFGVSSDECLNYALENRKEWVLKGEAIIEDIKERYHKRKALVIGGFTPDEIESFDKHEVQYILDLLVKRGRAFGTFKGTDKNGQRLAAQAWLDALEIYERAPAAPDLVDKTIIFPIYSGILVFLKGGRIQQDSEHTFEWNLAELFVRQTDDLGDPVHFTRALGMLCEVQAQSGNLKAAIATFETLSSMYDPKLHSADMCNFYGTDRVAHVYSQQVLWHDQLGNQEKAMKAYKFVLNKILPRMDLANILNSFELLYPIFRYLAPRGRCKEMSDLLDRQIIKNCTKHKVDDTPCRLLFKPLKTLFDIMADPDRYTGYKDAIEWFLEEENCIMDDFVDNIYSKLGWSPNTITASICLYIANKLLDDTMNLRGATINSDLTLSEIAHKLLANGLLAARHADWKMIDDEGDLILPIPYQMHMPILTELEGLVDALGIEVPHVQPQQSSPDLPLKTRLGLVWIN